MPHRDRTVAALRFIFLIFMTWLLVVFLPGHKRGAITLGPREAGDRCCAPAVAEPVVASCCAAKAKHDAPPANAKTADTKPANPKPAEPTSKDRANCAVCFWGAGLLSSPAFVLDLSHDERAFEHARHYHAQVQRVACRLNQFGRDPPSARLA